MNISCIFVIHLGSIISIECYEIGRNRIIFSIHTVVSIFKCSKRPLSIPIRINNNCLLRIKKNSHQICWTATSTKTNLLYTFPFHLSSCLFSPPYYRCPQTSINAPNSIHATHNSILYLILMCVRRYKTYTVRYTIVLLSCTKTVAHICWKRFILLLHTQWKQQKHSIWWLF